MRYLWIIRHAKSADGSQDHARGLNARGEADGKRMQAWYSAQTNQAAWIWSSNAKRAMLTANFVARGFGGQVIPNPELYLAGPEAVLDCLRTTPKGVDVVAVVAHNPGLTHCVNLLGPDHITDNLVTFGSVLFRTKSAWQDLQLGQCELISQISPKQIN